MRTASTGVLLQAYPPALKPMYLRRMVPPDLSSLGYVIPPVPATPPPGTAAAAAAAAGFKRKTVFLDLHETLVRVEPLGAGAFDARGAPERCTEGGWKVQGGGAGAGAGAGGVGERMVIHGPEGCDFSLTLRPGSDAVAARLRDHDALEGVLWTVGGLLYVRSVIEGLERAAVAASGGRGGGEGRVAFEHVVRSDSMAHDERGVEVSRSDWPLLLDLKPLALTARPLGQCLQVDDRPEYLRLNPENALIVAPFVGSSTDSQMGKVAEILDRLAETDLPVPEFLLTLPETLCKKQPMGGGVSMSCVM